MCKKRDLEVMMHYTEETEDDINEGTDVSDTKEDLTQKDSMEQILDSVWIPDDPVDEQIRQGDMNNPDYIVNGDEVVKEKLRSSVLEFNNDFYTLYWPDEDKHLDWQ